MVEVEVRFQPVTYIVTIYFTPGLSRARFVVHATSPLSASSRAAVMRLRALRTSLELPPFKHVYHLNIRNPLTTHYHYHAR